MAVSKFQLKFYFTSLIYLQTDIRFADFTYSIYSISPAKSLLYYLGIGLYSPLTTRRKRLSISLA